MTSGSFSIDPSAAKRVEQWLTSSYIDEETKATIRSLQKEDLKQLNDAFYTDLSFGTAGMRGLMGVGTNRLNIYTIRLATQGLAHYLRKETQTPSVVIGFDSRHHSKLFAQEAARVLAGNEILVYLLKDLRPTPFISFAVRYQKATAGIMITASHNPAVYNGYKVYWSDGAQVVSPHDTGIVQEVHAIKEMHAIPLADLSHPFIHVIDASLDAAYLEAIRPLALQSACNHQMGKSLKITYSSLHGTGITLAPQALQEGGFSNIHLVEKQCIPDGDFPTVSFPNPEFKEALQMGIDTLLSTSSDIFIVNDPDADRLGIAVLHKGKAEILTGNEIASLCVSYLCSTLKAQNILPSKGAFITTIVSTQLQKVIASSYGLPCFEVLTGFKYIGEMIHKWENSPDGYQFLFGAEESLGFLRGTHARDKDAIVSSCLLAEIALQAKLQGKTLIDALYALYKTYGVYRERQLSLEFEASEEGMKKISSLMEQLRKAPPKLLMGQEVVVFEDYQMGKRILFGIANGKEESLTLPKSNVLLFRLRDQSSLIVRPSGTEPKIKLYAATQSLTKKDVSTEIQQCEDRLTKLLTSAQQLLSYV